jgi:predicted nucleic-acid-binding protein
MRAGLAVVWGRRRIGKTRLLLEWWVLDSVYDLGPSEIWTAVDMLLNYASLTVQDSDVVIAALVHFGAKPALGFSDCLMLEAARKAGHLSMGTFDLRLGKLEGTERL